MNNQKTSADPSQREEAPTKPGLEKKEAQPKEGDFRNVETGVNNPDEFTDDYESSRENEITEEEADTEKEGRTGKS